MAGRAVLAVSHQVLVAEFGQGCHELRFVLEVGPVLILVPLDRFVRSGLRMIGPFVSFLIVSGASRPHIDLVVGEFVQLASAQSLGRFDDKLRSHCAFVVSKGDRFVLVLPPSSHQSRPRSSGLS